MAALGVLEEMTPKSIVAFWSKWTTLPYHRTWPIIWRA
jgi:hypothetical protein